jgi:hypothetical protein
VQPERDPYRRFSEAIPDLLAHDPRFRTLSGGVNIALFHRSLKGDVNYESLRKSLASERFPSRELMEAVADALEVDPIGFPEYRLLLLRDDLDRAWNDYNGPGFDKALARLRADERS